VSFFQKFSNQNSVCVSFFPVWTTSPACCNHPDFTVLTILGDLYKFFISLFCNVLNFLLHTTLVQTFSIQTYVNISARKSQVISCDSMDWISNVLETLSLHQGQSPWELHILCRHYLYLYVNSIEFRFIGVMTKLHGLCNTSIIASTSNTWQPIFSGNWCVRPS
jgi:hypothetical protein